ncbi:hypothetical protein OS493_001682 [Desmophyllum pertusum]|uniref:Uncharacterized protein n=1 Tax=Desmophyllum pertusum TaxID=174260 RepID=A0A9W9ZH01_9CNID|nr:hypothetical protein OS493_001682 [Desmophyllum pertusum]
MVNSFVKDLRKTGKVAGVVHKKPISKQQIQRLYECGELGPADSTNPAQLQRTAWFYLVLYLGRRGRENQRQMKSNMLVFRKTSHGKEFCEPNREMAGSLLSSIGRWIFNCGKTKWILNVKNQMGRNQLLKSNGRNQMGRNQMGRNQLWNPKYE